MLRSCGKEVRFVRQHQQIFSRIASFPYTQNRVSYIMIRPFRSNDHAAIDSMTQLLIQRYFDQNFVQVSGISNLRPRKRQTHRHVLHVKTLRGKGAFDIDVNVINVEVPQNLHHRPQKKSTSSFTDLVILAIIFIYSTLHSHPQHFWMLR